LSVRAQSAVWEHSTAGGNTLVVLLRIADHADDYGIAWPGIDTPHGLSWSARCSRATVQRAITKLEEAGELQVFARNGETNVYLIRLPGLADVGEDAWQKLERLGVGGGRILTPVAPSREGGVATVLPEPKGEPSPTDTSLRSVSGDGVALALAHEPKTEHGKIAMKHLTPILGAASDGYAYNLRDEVEEAWTPAIQEARDSGVNPKAVGIAIAASYIHAITGEDVRSKDWGIIGRLVGSYGKLAIRGIEAAYMRAVDEGDGPAWIAYASATCKRLYEEREA
jgi:hypothetical protein